MRCAYDYDVKAASNDAALVFPVGEVSKTQQQFKDECDINTIVGRFGLTGEIPTSLRRPLPESFEYGRFEFQEMLNLVRQAQEGFMDLPSAVRDRFNNDPQRLYEFLEVESNRDEAIKLGLVKGPVEPVVSPDANVTG